MKMKCLYKTMILMLQLLKSVNLQGLVMLNDENQRNMEVAVTSPGNPEVTEVNNDNVKRGGSSFESLEKLYDVAKNISHSKGIYRDNENKENTGDKPEVRRSILRKIAVETESDVIKTILNSFKAAKNKVASLDQIEYMVHQYDVAVHFAQMGGIEILTPFLFSSDDHIASSVASVLGAAMQSNPTVQALAMKKNVGGNLLKLLSHKSPRVLSSVIFALGSFLRNVPDAQEEFFALNGILKLANILKQHKITINTKLKIINLFSDISVELQASQFDHGTTSQEKISRRTRIFNQEMQLCNICKLVPSFLYLEDFDTHEKVISAMISLQSSCLNEFQNEYVVNRIKHLMRLYNPVIDVSTPVYPVIDEDLKSDLWYDLVALLDVISYEDMNQTNKRHRRETSEL